MRRLGLVVGVAVVCLAALSAVAGSVDTPLLTGGVGYEVTVPVESLLDRGNAVAGRLVASGGNAEPVGFGPNEISTPLGKLVVLSLWLVVAFRKMDALAGLLAAVTGLFVLVGLYVATAGGTATTNAPLLGELPPPVAFLVLAAALLAALGAVVLSAPERFRRPTEHEAVVPVLDRLGRPVGGRTADDPAPDPSPENPVERAWWDVTRRVDRDSWATRTPREIERAAGNADLPSATVRDLRRLFEEVRYGGAPATEDRQRRARELRERLDTGDSGDADAGDPGEHDTGGGTEEPGRSR